MKRNVLDFNLLFEEAKNKLVETIDLKKKAPGEVQAGAEPEAKPAAAPQQSEPESEKPLSGIDMAKEVRAIKAAAEKLDIVPGSLVDNSDNGMASLLKGLKSVSHPEHDPTWMTRINEVLNKLQDFISRANEGKLQFKPASVDKKAEGEAPKQVPAASKAADPSVKPNMKAPNEPKSKEEERYNSIVYSILKLLRELDVYSKNKMEMFEGGGQIGFSKNLQAANMLISMVFSALSSRLYSDGYKDPAEPAGGLRELFDASGSISKILGTDQTASQEMAKKIDFEKANKQGQAPASSEAQPQKTEPPLAPAPGGPPPAPKTPPAQNIPPEDIQNIPPEDVQPIPPDNVKPESGSTQQSTSEAPINSFEQKFKQDAKAATEGLLHFANKNPNRNVEEALGGEYGNESFRTLTNKIIDTYLKTLGGDSSTKLNAVTGTAAIFNNMLGSRGDSDKLRKDLTKKLIDLTENNEEAKQEIINKLYPRGIKKWKEDQNSEARDKALARRSPAGSLQETRMMIRNILKSGR